MDQKFRTSFIPKQEVIRTDVRPASSFRFSVFSIIALSLFALASILALSVFLYQRVLASSLDKMSSELVAARSAFEPTFIDSLVRMDHRIESEKKILGSHNSVDIVLKILEGETLKAVRFTNFQYTYDSNGKMTMSMDGEARDFLTIASQSELWSGENRIINPIFNDLNLNDSNLAKFSFTSSLNSPLFFYKNNFTAAAEATSTGSAPESKDGEIQITPVNDNEGILPGEAE